MISDNQLRELRLYRDMERNLPVQEEPRLGALVVAMGNEQLPIHRWFRFKEGYSGDLLEIMLSKYARGKTDLVLLDPFCGVGTSLVSAQTLRTHRIYSIGIEYNPFIRFAAATKLSWPDIDPERMLRLAERVIKAELAPHRDIPRLSGFATGRCMSPYVARRLLGIRDCIRQDGDTPTHKALLLGLAACVEPLSRTRKDGRALRLVDRPRQLVVPHLMNKWRLIAEDARAMQQECPEANPTRISAGDGRVAGEHLPGPKSIDLVVTSPPYLNNIDYTEVYKLELWLMGFVVDSQSFLRLRKGTMRSHPTSALSDEESEFQRLVTSKALMRPFDSLLSKLDTDREKWRRKLFVAYFVDVLSALEHQFMSLRKGGLAFIVVGNSLHGGQYAPYLVATDILMSELARSVGFDVERVLVARTLRRRLSGNHFLRESVIVLRKPNV